MLTIVSVAVSESRQWRFYSHDASMMSRWHDDDRIIAVQPMVIYFSREKQVSVAPKDVYRPSIFFLSLHYPLTLAVNKSPAVYILSPDLDGLWRENRGSVNRLNLGRIDSFVVWILVTSYENWQYLQLRSQGCLSSFEKEPWLRPVTWKCVSKMRSRGRSPNKFCLLDDEIPPGVGRKFLL